MKSSNYCDIGHSLNITGRGNKRKLVASPFFDMIGECRVTPLFTMGTHASGTKKHSSSSRFELVNKAETVREVTA